jgi:hypothetical protein
MQPRMYKRKCIARTKPGVTLKGSIAQRTQPGELNLDIP